MITIADFLTDTVKFISWWRRIGSISWRIGVDAIRWILGAEEYPAFGGTVASDFSWDVSSLLLLALCITDPAKAKWAVGIVLGQVAAILADPSLL
jgi:hypothetical protein